MTSSSPQSLRPRLARGLYLVTPDDPDTARLLARVESLLPFAACLQYRSKAAGTARRETQARALHAMCDVHGVPLIINDDVELAADIGADGVHLGEHDAGLASARARLPTGLILSLIHI